MTAPARGDKMLSDITCSIHQVPMLVTQSGLQHVCPQPDCDEHVRAQGPKKESDIMSPKTATPIKPENNDPERKKQIEEVMAKKKADAVKPGIVTPDKPDRKAKPPAEANMTTGKTKKQEAKKVADKELDEGVKKAATKPKKEEKDPNLLSVSDIAKSLGLDPKRARAKLRKQGQSASEGRWPKVKRGSKEHQALVDLLSPNEEADDVEEEEGQEEQEEAADDDEN